MHGQAQVASGAGGRRRGWPTAAPTTSNGTMLDRIMTGVDAFLNSYRDRLQGELAGFAERLSDLSSYPFFVTPAHRLHWI